MSSILRVKRSALGSTTEVGAGGQGKVYRFATVPPELSVFGFPLLFKEYDRAARSDLEADVLRSMVRRSDQLQLVLLRQRLAWPLALVTDGRTPVGFVMQQAPPEFDIELQLPTGPSRRVAQLQYVLNDRDYLIARRIPASDQWRLQLLRSVAQTLSDLHAQQIVVGDLSPNNLLASFSARPTCFFLDCDGMQLDGETALPQVQTPGWEVRSGESAATIYSDAFKFALLVTRLFAGSQDSRDPAAIAAIDPRLGELARRGMADDPYSRPRPAEWISLFDVAALGASSRLPWDPVPPPPPPRPTAGAVPVSAAPAPAARAPLPVVLAGVLVTVGVLVLAVLGIGLLQDLIGASAGPGEPPTIVAATGTPLVAIDPAAAVHPRAAEVVNLLDRHFTAINHRDYDSWTTTVVPSRSWVHSRDEWQRAYRSTTDEAVSIVSISDTQFGELAVDLTFVSNQAVADAPRKMPVPRICWTATWSIRDVTERGVLGIPTTTGFRPC